LSQERQERSFQHKLFESRLKAEIEKTNAEIAAQSNDKALNPLIASSSAQGDDKALNSLIALPLAPSDDKATALSKQFKTDYNRENISDSVKTVSTLHSTFNYANNVVISHIFTAPKINESNRWLTDVNFTKLAFNSE